MSYLREREVILFQGDSVTDCGRDRADNDSLGTGYPLLISSYLAKANDERDFTFINKGISGNRVSDLGARWDDDCILLKPTVLSILIGINDTWRRYDSNDPTSVYVFEEGYRRILTRAKNEISTDVKIILLEPFVLPVLDEQYQWREDLDPKIHAVRKLSREFDALYIPLDGIFAAACTKRPPSFWAEDGVHPTDAGHRLISDAWISTVNSAYDI